MEVMKNKSEEMIWKLIKKKLNPGQDWWFTIQTCMTHNEGSLIQKKTTTLR